MKIVAIIQARMTSTRLPGKVLKKVLGKTLLEFQLERVARSKYINEIVVATTINNTDDTIVDLCTQLKVPIYRGSEEDVLSRYYEAAIQSEANIVVRLTSDCPLIDPGIVDQVIELYLSNPSKDYASNTLIRTYPLGMDTEVFNFHVLEEAFNKATLQRDREHVTSYIYRENKEFQLINLSLNRNISFNRWTVDTKEDYLLIKEILERIYPENPYFSMDDIINLINKYPELSEINKGIRQKKI
ncbi:MULTISPECIES: glycosyltransferase family protein [unclassified Sporosarcina]|uniref:glycosyltransferase family protein n=1 Tax=unclassified Sporosarcina TaxID=2647733 RepID=UPI002040B413|nr:MULTISPECIES: glycosyltransferase family protein [unclassified Sporosarcina]GKV64858.1 spore coat protein [Sporosarcina sp. NCCP-2331]GLB54968.1 spore coat protein [Sporosarcina sp. NCCP-2378]